jgi:ubiquinone/menaquinone biosynthesis C-methylase UbiE
MSVTEKDYVLGTHDAEIARLQLQHGIWRETVHECWQRAGIAKGQRVLDIGCGPGFASADLAKLVGEHVQLIGLERSERFLEFAKAFCENQQLNQVQFIEKDVMEAELELHDLDAAWCLSLIHI